jgi:diguanylate cyclase (GGDEF)-like protein
MARIGGDEFVVILRDPDEGILAEHLDRLRSVVEQCGLTLGLSELSVSIGALVADSSFVGADAILAEADRRMYADKRGRHARRSARTPDFLSVSRRIDRDAADACAETQMEPASLR